jgi:hypothetical protein
LADNVKYRPWIYKIAGYQWDNLGRKLSDLLELKSLPPVAAKPGAAKPEAKTEPHPATPALPGDMSTSPTTAAKQPAAPDGGTMRQDAPTSPTAPRVSAPANMQTSPKDGKTTATAPVPAAKP